MAAIIPITMPKFGLAMTEGKIASWAVAEGSSVRPGDEIADIETSKITNAYESPVAGVLRRHVAPEHEDLPVGALIAVVADADTPDAEIDAFVTEFQAAFESGRGEAELAPPPPPPEPVLVEIAGEMVRFLEVGAAHAGSPVILIHGFGAGSARPWRLIQAGRSRRRGGAGRGAGRCPRCARNPQGFAGRPLPGRRRCAAVRPSWRGPGICRTWTKPPR